MQLRRLLKVKVFSQNLRSCGRKFQQSIAWLKNEYTVALLPLADFINLGLPVRDEAAGK